MSDAPLRSVSHIHIIPESFWPRRNDIINRGTPAFDEIY